MAEPAATALQALQCLDLTLLGDDDSREAVRRLCDRAVTPWGAVAAVCLWPRFVTQARRHLADQAIAVAAVANFPAGADDRAAAVAETRAIRAAGGQEVDLVFPYRTLMNGRRGVGRDLVAACKEACGEAVRLKVILESGVLAEPALIRAAGQEALEGGADFLKTSTGKTAVSATPEAARTMLELLRDSGRAAGFKASGGVRDLATAALYLDSAASVMGPDWVSPQTFRFGASGLLDALVAALTEEQGR